jgi:hypothetical protein
MDSSLTKACNNDDRIEMSTTVPWSTSHMTCWRQRLRREWSKHPRDPECRRIRTAAQLSSAQQRTDQRGAIVR